jgi:signal transduction histidine kinase
MLVDMKGTKRRHLPYVLVAIWFIFTASLAGWWYLFGVEQTERILELEASHSPTLSRHLKMLRWEGLTLLLSIVVGAGGMLYFIVREMRHAEKLQMFFSTFTHELKTPLASVQLQAESLKEDLAGTANAKLAERLVADTQRLTLQLENSLYLAEDGNLCMYREAQSLSEFIDSLRPHWPALHLAVYQDAVIEADLRALECIMRNILQNALTHGKSTSVVFQAEASAPSKVKVKIQDNGQGLQIERSKLGKLFGRLSTGSGNGIGLYITSRLAERLGGRINYPEQPQTSGFCIELELPGVLI